MSVRPDRNLDTWNQIDVASYYASLSYLTPCEQLLFDEYLGPGMAILDLGVGGGRTTSYLSSIASRYVGADYAAEMIAACQKRFPHLEFKTVDAADLSMFPTATFDAVVMAFNTIDNVIPEEARHRALREIHRVLKPNGVLIFSSHNIRSIFARPAWKSARLASLARHLAGDGSAWYRPLLGALTAARVPLAVYRAVVQSIGRIARRCTTPGFWRGEGYLTDSSHGGTTIHFGTPDKVEEELVQFGFRLQRYLGDDYPRVSRILVTGWYYYVSSRVETAGLKVICK
ncbi:MAG TPA: class I SAM-dependent methyltransferase [Terriglobales bacterium]|nr:class I SAM-dependent methyltransferase [Terriglobales bacterium]